jgi:membrane-bound lytic murein transglycosylase D
LMELNGADNSRLQLGQILKVPVGAVRVAEASTPKANNLATDAKTGSYEVRNGDNLYSISRRLGVALSDLQRWNNLGASTDIRPGQKLLVKDSATGKLVSTRERSASYYVVRSGDNLWDIARRHNISVQQIDQWNNLAGKKLKPGMRIKVSP